MLGGSLCWEGVYAGREFMLGGSRGSGMSAEGVGILVCLGYSHNVKAQCNFNCPAQHRLTLNSKFCWYSKREVALSGREVGE